MEPEKWLPIRRELHSHQLCMSVKRMNEAEGCVGLDEYKRVVCVYPPGSHWLCKALQGSASIIQIQGWSGTLPPVALAHSFSFAPGVHHLLMASAAPVWVCSWWCWPMGATSPVEPLTTATVCLCQPFMCFTDYGKMWELTALQAICKSGNMTKGQQWGNVRTTQ